MRDHSDMIIVRMTAILVSRFLLDLQAANQKSLKVAQDDPLYSSRMGDNEDNGQGVGPLFFAGFDVVGSLGASLALSEHASDGMEDEAFREGIFPHNCPRGSWSERINIRDNSTTLFLYTDVKVPA